MTRSSIEVKYRSSIKSININDIYYFSADQKYIMIYYKNGHLLTCGTLKSLEKEFSEFFIRIHRNALVAKKHIKHIDRDSIGKWFIRLNNKKLEVSRRNVPLLLDLLEV